MQRISVDFPAPDEPIIPTISPGLIANSTPRTAGETDPRYVFVSPLILSISKALPSK
jgi:hypothetical protein